MGWYLMAWKRYADFEGRSRRMEYWMFALIHLIITVVLMGADYATGIGILGGLYGLAAFIPSLAISVRRLHDTNRSGWWLLVALVPIIGAIMLLVFALQDSDLQHNQFGPNPKAMVTA